MYHTSINVGLFGLKMKVALREAKVPFLVFYVAFFDTISPGLCGSLTFSLHSPFQKRQLVKIAFFANQTNFNDWTIWSAFRHMLFSHGFDVIFLCSYIFCNCSSSSQVLIMTKNWNFIGWFLFFEEKIRQKINTFSLIPLTLSLQGVRVPFFTFWELSCSKTSDFRS